MTDFVLNVKQIGNYPQASSAGLNDLLLLQVNGLGGAYSSIAPVDLVGSSLNELSSILLKTTTTINWNGASLGWNGSRFTFSAGINTPAVTSTTVQADTVIANTTLQLGTDNVATQPWVTSALDQVSNEAAAADANITAAYKAADAAITQAFEAADQAIIENTVWSFNDRSGDVVLLLDDILLAGGAPIASPHFGGHVTAPTPWNLDACDDTVPTTQWVQNVICRQLDILRQLQPFVFTFNGRSGDVVLTADDISAANLAPGATPDAPTAPAGDSSTRIANTAFVDDAVSSLQAYVQQQLAALHAQDLSYFAPINSPNFTGIPMAPTAAPGTNTGQLATTAFVRAAVVAATTGVSSFNTRTGAVVLQWADVSGVGGAPLASPGFTGTPTVPTPTVNNNTNQVPNCAWVLSQIGAISSGVITFNGRAGAVTLQLADVTGVGGAPLGSPNFTGVPQAPTATAGTSTNQIASTAFVQAALSAAPGGVSSFNTRTGAITLLGGDISAAGGALIASPVFTGTPQAPTPVPADNSAAIATTAFVKQAIAASVSGVLSLNNLVGALGITAGAGISISTVSPNVQVSAVQFTANAPGMVPQSGGGTTNFLRSDGNWAPGGANGAPGTNATTTTTAAFTVPAVGSSTTVTVADPSWMMVGQSVWVANAAGSGTSGPLKVTAIAGNTVTLLNPVISPGVSSLNNLTGAVNLAPANVAGNNLNLIGPQPLNINPAMQVSQEFGQGASQIVAVSSSTYAIDGYRIFTSSTSTVTWTHAAPSAGFSASPNGGVLLLIKNNSAVSSLAAGDLFMINSYIEGLDMAGLNWGTAQARPVVVRFNFQSPVAGTFSMAFRNAGSGGYRSYVRTFSIAAGQVNTQVPLYFTVPGDTAGTWAKDATLGANISVAFACSSTYTTAPNAWTAGNFVAGTGQSNGFSVANNNFQISDFAVYDATGYATDTGPPFIVPDYRTELQRCMRYFEKVTNIIVQSPAASTMITPYSFKVQKRATPVMTTIGTPSYSSASAATLNTPTVDCVGLQFTASAAAGYVSNWTFTADARP